MMTFFTILLILVGANALFMVFSLNSVSSGGKKTEENTSKDVSSKVYPLNSLSSKFKKAV